MELPDFWRLPSTPRAPNLNFVTVNYSQGLKERRDQGDTLYCKVL